MVHSRRQDFAGWQGRTMNERTLEKGLSHQAVAMPRGISKAIMTGACPFILFSFLSSLIRAACL